MQIKQTSIINDQIKTEFFISYPLGVPGCNVGQSSCKECDHVCTAPQAYIASCNYPNVFEENLDCTWQIITAKGTYVQLTFKDFDIPSTVGCTQNRVIVYDGENDGDIIDTFCNERRPDAPEILGGESVKPVIRASFNKIAVKMITTAYRKGRGFLAEYEAETFTGDIHTSANMSEGKSTAYIAMFNLFFNRVCLIMY